MIARTGGDAFSYKVAPRTPIQSFVKKVGAENLNSKLHPATKAGTFLPAFLLLVTRVAGWGMILWLIRLGVLIPWRVFVSVAGHGIASRIWNPW